MRTITLEEHFISPGFLAGPGKEFTEQMRHRGPRRVKIYEQLQDVGAQRIAEMDAAGIDMQVLSLNSPGVEQAEAAEQVAVATESNDFLAEAVKKHPTRFAAFAANNKNVGTFDVAPLNPMAIEQTIGDVCFNFGLTSRFFLFAVAILVFTVRIDFRSKGNPFPVRRPNGT